MSTPVSLEEAIAIKSELMDAIRAQSRKLTVPIMLVMLKTFGIPVLVFLAAWIAGGYFRAFMNNQFQDASINSSAQVAASIAVVALTVVAWRWSEKRFGGIGLLRRLAGVSRAVLQVETAIETAKGKPAPSSDEIAEIDHLAHEAWNTYVKAMRAYGFQVNA